MKGVGARRIYQWEKGLEITMTCSLNFSIKLEIAAKVLCEYCLKKKKMIPPTFLLAWNHQGSFLSLAHG